MTAPSRTDRAGRAQRADLADEHDLLRRSLEDAAREHRAGDLSDEDYRVLRARDERRLREVERALASSDGDGGAEDGGPGGHGGRPDDGGAAERARRRRFANLAGVVGAALVVLGAVVLVVRLTAPRQPGQIASGTVQLSQAQRITEELTQADRALDAGNVKGAVTLYSAVLDQDPDDPPALSQMGWLTYEKGVQAKVPGDVTAGTALVARAVTVDPSFGPARLYDGVILLGGGDPAGAVAQFTRFLHDQPSAQNLCNGAPFIRRAFAQAHQAVPAGVPAGTCAAGGAG